MNLSPMEVKISKRRLLSAVCLFGGYKVNTNICQDKHFDSAITKSHNELHYEKQLPFRYFENETRLSWDIEENPPVENIRHGSLKVNPTNNVGRGLSTSVDDDFKQEKTIYSSDDTEQFLAEENASFVEEEGTKRSNESTKAKYRCKLCGQPKQNHTCPYQQSLQRSIGTMSYAALNAFECNEPGKLATTLSEMNNFFNLFDDDQIDPSLSNCDSFGHTVQGLTFDRNLSKMEFSSDGNAMPEDHAQSLKSKKRKISILSSFSSSCEGDYSNDCLLRTKSEMRPEQYRAVSEDNSSSSSYGSFNYPDLPLTTIQRRCMSDSLYNLSRCNHGLLDEVSNVLDEAQRGPLWDVAVAELLAQVLVIQYCPIGDKTLEGLCRYLLKFGISC